MNQENLELFGVRIDKDIKKEFKTICKSEGRSLQWQVEQLVVQFIKDKKNGGEVKWIYLKK